MGFLFTPGFDRPLQPTHALVDPSTDTTETDEDDDAGESVHPSGAL